MAGALTISTLNNDTGVLATQNGMNGIAKAWVNYNGATSTINGSFNISSVTRNSAGRYVLNFTTAMPNANYSTVGMARRNANNSDLNTTLTSANDGGVYTTASVSVTTATATGYGIVDADILCVTVTSS
jgi:hypothetical protein